MSIHTVSVALLVIVAAAGLGWLVWISVQSLRQARLLGSLPSGTLRSMANRAVALHGPVHVDDPLTGSGLPPCLWRRQIVEERSTWGRSRSWQTVADQAEIAGFTLAVGGVEVEIGELPSEVQGYEHTREYDGSPFLSAWLGGASNRCTNYWLPILDQMTVLGRLEERQGRSVLVRDPQLGLLFSPDPPDAAARTEMIKGWLGLVGVIAGIIAAIWIYETYLR